MIEIIADISIGIILLFFVFLIFNLIPDKNQKYNPTIMIDNSSLIRLIAQKKGK